jgi:hypothetical protein
VEFLERIGHFLDWTHLPLPPVEGNTLLYNTDWAE